MSAAVGTVGDPRIALDAGPLLAAFNRRGVLAAADVQVARRLGRLAGETDERVLLAVALAVRAVRAGSICVDLTDPDVLTAGDSGDGHTAVPPTPADWPALVAASPLVAVGVGDDPGRPVRLVGGRVYLDRYWRDEQVVRTHVDARLGAGPPPGAEVLSSRLAEHCHRLFPAVTDGRQRLATAAAVLGRVTVVTGGPGTGKTTTVARLLAVLQAVAGPGLRVALAAPTGKAAARLQEAVRAELAGCDPQDRRRVGDPTAGTLHRLLGWVPGSSTRFAHHRGHRLPHDVVVVDETSMVSLPLMARLLEALRPQARLVLVGDPDQLASVEAGAVLGDLVGRAPVADGLTAALAAVLPGDLPAGAGDLEALRNGVVRLDRGHRFDQHGPLGRLAAAIRSGDAEEVLAVLAAGDPVVLRAGDPAVQLVEPAGELPGPGDVLGVRADVERSGLAVHRAARAGDVSAALAALDEHRLLVAHRRGPFGVTSWAAQVEAWVGAAVAERCGAVAAPGRRPRGGPWYPGRPLLVTGNDRDSGLYNGDTGVVVTGPDGGPLAAFGDPERPLLVRPHRLPAVETVHAMTVHRGQGSQFAAVTVVLPPAASPLLTRELLYTAVTRARHRLRVIGSRDAVRAAVTRPVRRASGLREALPAPQS